MLGTTVSKPLKLPLFGKVKHQGWNTDLTDGTANKRQLKTTKSFQIKNFQSLPQKIHLFDVWDNHRSRPVLPAIAAVAVVKENSLEQKRFVATKLHIPMWSKAICIKIDSLRNALPYNSMSFFFLHLFLDSYSLNKVIVEVLWISMVSFSSSAAKNYWTYLWRCSSNKK